MQGLKALVIFLGVLIILGVGVLIYGIAAKFGTLSDNAATPAETTAGGVAPASPQGFGKVEVPLPPGARIIAVRTDGNRLLAHFVLADDAGQGVVIFNLATGRETGTVFFRPGGAQ